METVVFMILDKDSPTEKRITDLKRQGLVADYRVWNRDFEDAFDSDIITLAMKSLAKRKNAKYELNKHDLDVVYCNLPLKRLCNKPFMVQNYKGIERLFKFFGSMCFKEGSKHPLTCGFYCINNR